MIEAKKKLVNLREHMVDLEEVIYEFASGLADRLHDEAEPASFALATALFMYDLTAGKSGFSGKPLPGRLVGYPPQVYASIGLYIKDIAIAIFDPEDIDEVLQGLIVAELA